MGNKWPLGKSLWLKHILLPSTLLLSSSFSCLRSCDLCAGHCPCFLGPAWPHLTAGTITITEGTRCFKCTDQLRNTDRQKKCQERQDTVPAGALTMPPPRQLDNPQSCQATFVPSLQMKRLTRTWLQSCLFSRKLLLLFSLSWQGVNMGCWQNYTSKATKSEGHSEPAVWSPQARGESKFKHPV